MHHIEIAFNLNCKKEFCFGIVIVWVAGKNCIVKSEKCTVFPEWQYVNLNPYFIENGR